MASLTEVTTKVAVRSMRSCSHPSGGGLSRSSPVPWQSSQSGRLPPHQQCFQYEPSGLKISGSAPVATGST
jgi:hypothetical protein